MKKTPNARAVGEEAFLAEYDISKFERPSVAVDVVVLTALRDQLRVALCVRAEHPCKGYYALPGGFVHLDESLDDAAVRVLREKAGLTGLFTEQLYTFGAVGRDPRGRIITVVYLALVHPTRFEGMDPARHALTGTLRVPWLGETGGRVTVVDDAGERLPIAFDHEEVLGMAIKRLRGKLDYTPVVFELLPQVFTLRELQGAYEAVRGAPVNKDSFRRRMLAEGRIVPTGERQRDTAHRPAELYRFETPRSA